MKKFIVLCMTCLFLFGCSLFYSDFDFEQIPNLSVQVFTSSCNNIKLNKYSTIQNGAGQVVFCSYDDYKDIKATISDISGVTFVFDGNREDFLNVINSLKVRFVEKSETSFVGFSNKFNSCVNYNSKKVNVQGYFNGEKIYIGTPLLLGSY